MNSSTFTIGGGLGQISISGNIISSPAGELRIIGRYPERGLPKPGVPFSVDVEVERHKNFWNSVLYVTCPDVVVAALNPQTRRPLALTRITTSMWEGCRGQARLVFDRSFKPDRQHPVVFELHKSDVTASDLSSAEPIASSKVMTLDLGMEQGKQSGVYAPPTEPWYQINLPDTKGAFSGVNSTLTKALWLIGIGAGVYFFAPLMPGIRDSVRQIAGKNLKKQEQ